MKKATISSPSRMSENQISEDISMTPLQRLDLAFKISDFAVSFHRDGERRKEESTSIQWIELHKVSTPNERNAR